MSGKPEQIVQIVQRLAERFRHRLRNEWFVVPREVAETIERELQPLADLIRAAQEVSKLKLERGEKASGHDIGCIVRLEAALNALDKLAGE